MPGIGSMVSAVNWKRNLFFVWLSQFFAMIGFGCCMPFIPLLLKDNLHIADDQLRGFYVSLYYLAGMVSLCIASVFWGILADRFGRKRMLLRASYAAALFYPMLVFAPNFWVLLSIRFVCSFFSGTVNPAQTLLVTTTPAEKHGFVLGTLSTAVWSGTMAGYLAGGLIVHYFSYTAAFLTCGAVYLFSGLLVHCFVGEHFVRPVSKTAKTRQSISSLATPGILWLMLMFLLMGIARRIEQPFVAMQVELVHGEAGAAFFTGIVSAAAALGGVFSGLLAGHLCDRFSPWKLIVPVLVFSGLAGVAQAYSCCIGMFIVCRFLVFFFAGGLQPILQLMLTKIIRPEMRGTYFGWTSSMSQAGGILCSFISGSIVWFGSVRNIFAVAAILFFLMLPLMIPAGRACRKELVKS